MAVGIDLILITLQVCSHYCYTTLSVMIEMIFEMMFALSLLTMSHSFGVDLEAVRAEIAEIAEMLMMKGRVGWSVRVRFDGTGTGSGLIGQDWLVQL